jgi:Holliday junction resolvase RusA-like endonuclease
MKDVVEFTIPLETPAKKNSRVFNSHTHKSFPSVNFARWHQAAVLHVRSQYTGSVIDFPVSIEITFTHGDLRRRDCDNGVSSILDLLCDCEILQDDNWQIVKHISVFNRYSKDNPSAYIVIRRL